MNKNNKIKGIALMSLSGLMSAAGQLFLKLGVKGHISFLVLGFAIYIASSGSTIYGLRFGELSFLYPFLCISYIFSAIFGYFFLGEILTLRQILAMLIIFIGIIMMGRSSK